MQKKEPNSQAVELPILLIAMLIIRNISSITFQKQSKLMALPLKI